MPTVDEAAFVSQSSLPGALTAGVQTISENQTVLFKKYVKVVLPFDKFVFWVRADLLSPSAIYGTTLYNRATRNAGPSVSSAAPQFEAQGSLHYETTINLGKDESFAINRVVFTSLGPINDLNAVSANEMYIAEFREIRFAFSQRKSFYFQAGLWHYMGDAVYPPLSTQLIEFPGALDMSNVVVSNSLPIWLTLNAFCPMYPSFAVPRNVEPPYASIHIDESRTSALQPIPFVDEMSNHWQLARDRVEITTYGLRNFSALDFQDYVLDFMRDPQGPMGLLNDPIFRDAKRFQTEIGALAQKKVIEFDVSYYQQRVRDVARQYILKAFIKNFFVNPPPAPTMNYVQNLPLAYEGPFEAGEVLPRVLFLSTVTLTRGIAYTKSTGNGVFNIYLGNPEDGDLVIVVTCVGGQNWPQLSYVNGPVVLYINQFLTVVAPASVSESLIDLTITLGSDP